jgi:hypothetical protein
MPIPFKDIMAGFIKRQDGFMLAFPRLTSMLSINPVANGIHEFAQRAA